MRAINAIILVVSIMCAIGTPVWANSLWQGVKTAEGSYFVDSPVIARKVNDIIFILIDETTNADTKAAQDTSAETKIKGEVKSWFLLDGWRNVLNLLKLQSPDVKATEDSSTSLPGWELNIKNEFEGDGSVVRSNSVETKLAARVVEVKPNGTILVEARRVIRVGNETGQLLVTGMARPDDINDDNQIESSKIAELNIAVVGRGEITSAARPGLITKLVGLLK